MVGVLSRALQSFASNGQDHSNHGTGTELRTPIHENRAIANSGGTDLRRDSKNYVRRLLIGEESSPSGSAVRCQPTCGHTSIPPNRWETQTQCSTCSLLTNSEMDSHSPFACVLLGQPTLRRRMKLGTFAALDQCIALRYTMTGMETEETKTYLAHHLALAGRTHCSATTRPR